MKQDKYSEDEKRLCQEQEQLIIKHTNICETCKTSFKEYKLFGISSTPPCKNFTQALKEHISKCKICNQANQKWNEDSISTTPEMREIVGSIKQGKLPSPNILKKVASHLFKELQMSSDEIRKVSEKADKAVRDGLEEEK